MFNFIKDCPWSYFMTDANQDSWGINENTKFGPFACILKLEENTRMR